MRKTLTLALSSTALIALAGCQSHTTAQVDAQTRETFVTHMQQALQRSIGMADTGEQLGAVTLQVVLDRNAAPIHCKARRKIPVKLQAQLPGNMQTSNYQALARLVEEQCWKTIYPVVPAAMYDNESSVDVRAPMVLTLPHAAQAPATPRRRANVRRQFFWQQLLRDEAVSSIGMASVHYKANAQGKIEGCLVQLHPHRLRPDAFRLDGQLQARLTSRCLQLDLQQIPAFSSNQGVPAEGYSVIDYAPWKVGRP
ncbi:hypothetical protein [Pseudomonas putida]